MSDRIAGLLLGTAVGDALGLPREGLSATRAQRMFGPEVRHALLFLGVVLAHGIRRLFPPYA